MNDATALDVLLSGDASARLAAAPGGATFSGDVDGVVERGVARGQVALHGRGVGVRSKKLDVRGNLDAVARVRDWNLEGGRLRIADARVVLDDVAARLGGGFAAGEVATDDAREQPADLTAAHIELRGAVREVDLTRASLQEADYHVLVADARVEDISRLEALLAPREGRPFAVESGRAHASGEIDVKASARTASGALRITLENGGVRFHDTHLAGDFALDARVKGYDAPESADFIDVSGSQLELRNVRAVGAKVDVTAWNGDVTLLHGMVRVSDAPAFDGLVQLHADDANPILAMALGNSLPRMVVHMLKAPQLSGQARLTVEPGRAAIREAHLRGGDVVAIGDYVVNEGHVRGAATIAKGPLSAGVKIDDTGTSVRLWGLEGWAAAERAATATLFGDAKIGEESDKRKRTEAKAKATAPAR